MTKDEFREAMAALPPITETAPPHTWPLHRKSLRRHAREDDPGEFLQWSTIVGTMFVGSGADFTSPEYKSLLPRYRNILPEPRFGAPRLMKTTEGVITSGNLIHQAYHLQQLEQTIGIQVQDLKSVVEFGGGYGAMVVLFRRLGFSGRYTIIDLPELSLIQEYYLSNTIGLNNVYLVDNYDGRRMRPDLFMAIYSISEVPVELRDRLLKKIQARHRFIAYQTLYTLPSGELVHNDYYFGMVAQLLKMKNWRNEVLGDHWYLCDAEQDR